MSDIYKSFTSHYILLPNAKIGKWPIVSIDKSGIILNVETRDVFDERPMLEMHPGIIVPAFIDIFQKDDNINLHFSKGTILLNNRFTTNQKADVEISSNISNIPNLLQPNNAPLLNRIIEFQKDNPAEKIENILYWATEWSADQTNMANKLGKIDTEFSPGLLVLQNIDLTTMIITENTTVKWLNKPSII